MVWFDDDVDDDTDDDFDDDFEDDEDDDDDDEPDDDEPETWQVSSTRLPAKSWHALTSGFELPRLAAIFQLSQRWNRFGWPGVPPSAVRHQARP